MVCTVAQKLCVILLRQKTSLPIGNPILSSFTVKPRPEAHMDMILFEVFLKNIHLIPQDQIVQ